MKNVHKIGDEFIKIIRHVGLAAATLTVSELLTKGALGLVRRIRGTPPTPATSSAARKRVAIDNNADE